jgi:hypothetical protein
LGHPNREAITVTGTLQDQGGSYRHIYTQMWNLYAAYIHHSREISINSTIILVDARALEYQLDYDMSSGRVTRNYISYYYSFPKTIALPSSL